MRNAMTVILLSMLIQCTQLEKTDTESIKSVAGGIIDADNRGAIDEVMNFYTREATLMPPGKPILKGQEAIRRNYEQIFNTSTVNFGIDIIETKIAGDWAYCTGRTYGVVMLKADSTSRNVNDKYIMVLVKEGNLWKIDRLMWN